MIPKTIEKQHVLQALEEIDHDGYDSRYTSTKHDLSYNGKLYPPKYVVSRSAYYAEGTAYPLSKFSGGPETNSFLKSRGFSTVEKAGQKSEANFWIFQGSPKIYDIVGALRDNAVKTWSVKAHKSKIKTGDKVILWSTGADSGCYALGTVSSDVENRTDDPSELKYYYDTPVSGASDRVEIRVDYNFCDNPILKTKLMDVSSFEDFNGGNQGTNFTATKEQYDTILSSVSVEVSGIRVSKSIYDAVLEERTAIDSILADETFKGGERESIVKTRIGQGKYREMLKSVWDSKCAVTGCDMTEILIASHIKPWSESDEGEKVDPYNGLLLTPNLDKLFDQHRISFDDEGTVIIPDSIPPYTQIQLGLRPGMKISKLHDRHKPYLEHHRAKFYEQQEKAKRV